MLAAAAPEIRSITGQADQQKKEASIGGTRTGGTIQAMQDIGSKVRGQIADVISGKREGAASGLERTGAQVSGVGLGETGLGLGAEGSAAGIASGLESNAITSRQVSHKIHSAAVADWSKLIGELLTTAFSPGEGKST